MLMTNRDADIIKLISQFGMLTTGQIYELIFETTTKKPLDRSMTRLISSKYLSVVGKHIMNPTDAGSGQRVVQLGTNGWDFCKRRGKYAPYRAIKHHMLEVGSAYVEMKRLEKAGDIKLLTVFTEPDSHVVIAAAKLKPDLFVELEVVADSRSDSLWIELDRGTESISVIDDMLRRYSNAFARATTEDIETFPLVVFLVPDEQRKRAIESRVRRLEEDSRQLFMVCLHQGFMSHLLDV